MRDQQRRRDLLRKLDQAGDASVLDKEAGDRSRAIRLRANCVIIHARDNRPIVEFSTDLPEAITQAEGKRWPGAEDGDFKLPTLPDLIAGKIKGRASEEVVTCFLNYLGLGYQFAAAGSVVYRNAKERGVGHELPTDWFTEDVHP